jgi:hypothetical protein
MMRRTGSAQGVWTMRVSEACLFAAAWLASGTALAARAIDVPPPTRAAVLNAPQPDAAAQADESSSLRQGVVADVSPKADWVYINGSWLRIAEGSTRLFRQGRPVQAGALSKGQLLKFTLAPGAADRKTLGVVYVP